MSTAITPAPVSAPRPQSGPAQVPAYLIVVAAALAVMPLGAVVVPALGATIGILAAAAMVGLLGVCYLATPRPLPAPSPILIALLVILAVFAIGTAAAPIAGKTVTVLGYFGVGIAFAIALAVTLADERWPLDRLGLPVVGALMVGGTLACGYALIFRSGSITGSFGGSVVSNRLTGPFSQPNELGQVAAVTVAVAIAVLAEARGRIRWLGAACGLIAAVVLVLCFSRGAWIGAAGAIAVIAVLSPASRRFILAGVVLLPVLVAVGAMTVGPSVARLVVARLASFGDSTKNPYDDRSHIYSAALRMWREHPVTGVGPGNYHDMVVSDPNSALRVSSPLHAHSLIFNTAADLGLIGLVALILLALACVRAIARLRVRARDRAVGRPGEGRTVGLAAGGGLAAAAAQGLVDYVWTNGILLVLAFTLIGLLGAYDLSTARQRKES